VASANENRGYKVTDKTLLGGEGTWDYLAFNNDTRQLFINRRGPGVTVFNVDTKQVIGVAEGTKGCSGTALAQEFNRGLTTISDDSVVKIFDLTTLALVATVPVGEDPDCIAYDPASKLAFSIGGKGEVTAIDPATGTVVGSIALPSKKVEFAVADGKGHLYVNLQDKGQVAVIDTKTLTLETTWSLNKGSLNTPMAIDNEKGRLFVGCRNGYLTVFDTANGKIVAELPILGFNPDSVVYDQATKTIFVANTNATMTVYKETAKGDYVIADNVFTQSWSKTMALDPKTHAIYLAGAETGKFIPKQTWPELIPDTFSVLTVSRK
jgi:DNA-binding beta-propeller fold protein YncE